MCSSLKPTTPNPKSFPANHSPKPLKLACGLRLVVLRVRSSPRPIPRPSSSCAVATDPGAKPYTLWAVKNQPKTLMSTSFVFGTKQAHTFETQPLIRISPQTLRHAGMRLNFAVLQRFLSRRYESWDAKVHVINFLQGAAGTRNPKPRSARKVGKFVGSKAWRQRSRGSEGQS